jgi:hypothetical protein
MRDQISKESARVAVFYLARGADQDAPAKCRRFRASYCSYPAGIKHDLHIIFKGYADDVDYEKARVLFKGLSFKAIYTADDSFDLGAYYVAAAQTSHDYVCFLNTSSEIQSDAWLLKLVRNLELPGVGIVAASGSYEAPAPHPGWKSTGFPNIHVRTNAFMMRRAAFLATKPEGALTDKVAVYQLEHGPNSITQQMHKRGLQSLVVGRDGRGYSPAFWPISETYRRGNQHNLLVRDNQTEIYRGASPSLKQLLFASAWGKGEVIDELLFSDEATETQPLTRLQGESGFGSHQRREDDIVAMNGVLSQSNETAVFYLARHAEGTSNILQFINSYKQHRSGSKHDLVIIWKGFESHNESKKEVMDNLDGVHFQSISIMDEVGSDVTAYRLAVDQLPHNTFCFLNTFSQIVTDDWLKILLGGFAESGQGLAGASGSSESFLDSFKKINRVLWLCRQNIPYNHQLALEWGHEIVKFTPDWLNRSNRTKLIEKIKYILGNRPSFSSKLETEFERIWNTEIMTSDSLKGFASYPNFPNPHIRSNAFIVDRETFVRALPTLPTTKYQCLQFESGCNSLTNIAIKGGIRPLVVGRNGQLYPLNQLKNSSTFRIGNQENLLVTDNQTRIFSAFSKAQQRMFTSLSLYAGEE